MRVYDVFVVSGWGGLPTKQKLLIIRDFIRIPLSSDIPMLLSKSKTRPLSLIVTRRAQCPLIQRIA